MILRIPSYYKDFTCIAERCKDSCCVGWEIDIDEETFAYYRNLPGDFGDRLRSHMTSGDENSFVLQTGGRCPFLNESNLCDIYKELGETSLCEICTEYPRFTLEYGNVREKCLGISCEEAGRILFEQTGKITLEEIELPDAFDGEFEAAAEGDFEEEEFEAAAEGESGDEALEERTYDDSVLEEGFSDDGEENEEEELHGRWLESARNQAISILQDRSKPVEERAALYLCFCQEVQEQMNEGNWNRPVSMDSIAGANRKALLCSGNGRVKDDFMERKRILDGMEILDEEWRSAIARVHRVYQEQTEEENLRMLKGFSDWYRKREYEYEHLLVYFTFRYFMKSVFDFQLLPKAQLAVFSFLVIRDMDAVRWADQKGNFSLEDRIDNARIYSKEVEHSEDNLEYLADSFIFDECFQRERLAVQLLYTR
ncbi:MAG: flagellin lysine-N-methylase [Clostridiales bacterium]|nr:flagellin lysine-N-methylase [Clostridiales bacterium]